MQKYAKYAIKYAINMQNMHESIFCIFRIYMNSPLSRALLMVISQWPLAWSHRDADTNSYNDNSEADTGARFCNNKCKGHLADPLDNF